MSDTDSHHDMFRNSRNEISNVFSWSIEFDRLVQIDLRPFESKVNFWAKLFVCKIELAIFELQY